MLSHNSAIMLSLPFCKLAFMATDKGDEKEARAGYAARLAEAFRLAKKLQPDGDPDRAWLAKEIGVSPQAVGGALGKIKKRPIQPFSAYNNIKAARALGVNMVWLATGEGAAQTGDLVTPQSVEEMGGFVSQLMNLFTHLDGDARDDLVAFANKLASGPNRRWTRQPWEHERRSRELGGFGTGDTSNRIEDRRQPASKRKPPQ